MFTTIFLQAQGGGDFFSMILPFVLMIVIFYFLILRPQTTKQKKERQFQDSLKPGARVVTTSGMHGRIAQIQEDGIILETLSGKLKFEKAAISKDFTQSRFPEDFKKEK